MNPHNFVLGHRVDTQRKRPPGQAAERRTAASLELGSATMELSLLASAWTFGSLQECERQVADGAFDGIEGPPPDNAAACRRFRQQWQGNASCFVAELCTGGDYAPSSRVPFEAHFLDLERGLPLAAEAGSSLVTCLAGSDSWPSGKAIEFIGRALELGSSYGLTLSFETHRGRPTFNPWSTQILLDALPELFLTCDFSHWCVVCERLLDDEPVVGKAIARALHIHARVGYAQGPQVPDPRAPEYAAELARHENWWTRIWQTTRARGLEVLGMTPEFGPDGYLHHAPFTNEPVADLTSINRWMAARQRQRFADFTAEPSSFVEP